MRSGRIGPAAAVVWCFVLALQAASPACAETRILQSASTTLSGKAIVIEQEWLDRPSGRLLVVHTADGQRIPVQLADPSQADKLITGMDIEVRGQWQHTQAGGGAAAAAAPGAGGATAHFAATSLRASGRARAAPTLTSVRRPATAAAAAAGEGGVHAADGVVLSSNALVTTSVSVIVIPIVGLMSKGIACDGTSLPQFTTAQVKSAVFQELNPGGATVGSTYNRCSFSKTQLTMNNSLVVDPVELPCSGNTGGVDWTFAKCEFNDFNGYADAANEALTARGIDLSLYKYKVYLLPPSQCQFVGLGYVGCDGTYECKAWIGSDFWISPAAIAHELGHNLFLAHAGAVNTQGNFDEYADLSGVMGYCCGQRCPNTAHAWQLGWISVQQLDGRALPLGQAVKVPLSSQSDSDHSGLRIAVSWKAGVAPLFVGYRTRTGGDSAAAENTFSKVHVYSANISNTFDPQVSTWEASLGAAGQSWSHPTAGLVVRVASMTPTSATVSLCRKRGPETLASCRAGVDNDCNGLVAAKDPACVLIMKRAAIRPVRRPAKRRM